MTDNHNHSRAFNRFLLPHAHLTFAFGDDWFARKAEMFARFFGTPFFLILQTIVVAIWMALNFIGWTHFDEYPFILLNLAFSLQAAYAAPLILLAQTRQAERDKAHSEADAQHREDLARASDERQQTQPTADGAVEVLARKGQKPRRVVGAPDAGREFLGTSKFIDTDHPKIRELAQRAGGYEDDCWTAALRLERYVSRNLKPEAAAALVPASEFASTWRGDCRHAALTLAALCRASNMPARTAVGLLYVEKGGRPALGFHMWTEVFIDGQWIGLDGTLGQGGIGAGHVKVSDHSWDKVESLAPLLPVQRLVGRLKGEVVRVDLGD